MPAPSYEDSIEKLVEDIRATAGSGSRQYDIAKAILDVKLQQMAVKQAKVLTFATWVLAFGSVVLVVTNIVLILLSIK